MRLWLLLVSLIWELTSWFDNDIIMCSETGCEADSTAFVRRHFIPNTHTHTEGIFRVCVNKQWTLHKQTAHNFFLSILLVANRKWMSHKAIADLEMNLHYNLFSCVKCDSHTHPKAIIVCRNDKMRFSYAKAIFSAPITSKHIWQWGSTLWGRIMTIHFNKNEKV